MAASVLLSTPFLGSTSGVPSSLQAEQGVQVDVDDNGGDGNERRPSLLALQVRSGISFIRTSMVTKNKIVSMT